MPVYYASSDYSRSWPRCLSARFPHAVITKITRLSDGWIKVNYVNRKTYWKGKKITRRKAQNNKNHATNKIQRQTPR